MFESQLKIKTVSTETGLELTDKWSLLDGVFDSTRLPVLQDSIEDDQKLPADDLVAVEACVVLHVAPKDCAPVVNKCSHDLESIHFGYFKGKAIS